ncbi:aspartate aminotransferase family protein [Eubacteriales bacterium OttesenSCG-928-K08]|nr:aspartate aminotransferase family protein [Eubacteriales bacterium OttesenSCG-928-K08]
MNADQLKDYDQTYIAGTYARQDVAFVSGKGAELFDETGRRYIDLGSGIGVNTFGVADCDWIEAVTTQANKLTHVSNYYYTQPQVELARMLCKRTGMKKAFFSNSGAEANECAIKTARKYASDKYGQARPNIITLQNSFHGRTISTLSATGQEAYHKNFGPFTTGFLYVPANNLIAMESALSRGDVCAIFIELIQGEGGVCVLDKEYVQAVARTAKSLDVLLMIDEVQTGNGRTGALYSYMQYDVMPDVVTTAKGIAGGLPFGATLLGQKVKDVLDAGAHGSTFGGNPVCAAAALSTLSRIDDALLADVRAKSEYIRNELYGAPGVLYLSGMGLMIGIECGADCRDIQKRCLERGVLVLTAKTKVRLLPPLNIPFPVLEEAITILKEELAK